MSILTMATLPDIDGSLNGLQAPRRLVQRCHPASCGVCGIL